MSIKLPNILTIVGPTASGKTDITYQLAIQLRHKYNKEVEIVSADSRQVYKDIPIASSHPPAEYLNAFKHYFMGALHPEDEFNAGLFGKSARDIIKILLNQKKFVIIVGGSGLYISSLIYGLFDYEIEVESEENLKVKQKSIRKELEQRLHNEGIENLLNELKRVDKESAEKMENVNNRRIVRALEAFYLTGIPISVLQKKKINIGFKPVQFGIQWDRQKLYDRINSRVDKMIESGLIDEIRDLKSRGYDYKEYNSLNTVGVKEVFDFLDGLIDKEKMIELIKQNTRRFAKRQMTWFKKDKNIKWIDTDKSNFEEVPKLILDKFSKHYSL